MFCCRVSGNRAKKSTRTTFTRMQFVVQLWINSCAWKRNRSWFLCRRLPSTKNAAPLSGFHRPLERCICPFFSWVLPESAPNAFSFGEMTIWLFLMLFLPKKNPKREMFDFKWMVAGCLSANGDRNVCTHHLCLIETAFNRKSAIIKITLAAHSFGRHLKCSMSQMDFVRPLNRRSLWPTV